MKNIVFGLLVIMLVSCSEQKVTEVISDKNYISAIQKGVLEELPFDDRRDFDNVNRGFIATRVDPVIKNPDGTLSMDLSEFDFMDNDAPSTVNPSLWRQGQLNSKHGLFKVTEGIYQVRGFDLANMTIIASDNGWIIVDPLTTESAAKAAMDLVDEHLGSKPIKAVIITHSHIDHFGGIKGIISQEEVDNGDIEIIAPEGFFESSISENVIAGSAMLRRAIFMFGRMLPATNEGMIGCGLGQKVSNGIAGIMKPTIDVNETGQKLSIDGVDMIFQNTPGAEAPAECMFYLPQFKAFCQAEEINHTLHNLYTLRGAHVRNGLKWAKYIDETIQMFGDDVEVSFGSHHWPTWGQDQVSELWSNQRDLYKFIHDETLYLANSGNTMIEIADMISLPESLSKYFANRGYYGTLSHNAKAQYQLYYGWFDANPANLNALPPTEASHEYVQYMGGAENIITKAKEDMKSGKYRWVAMVLNHVVFDDPKNQEAKNLLAETYTQLGYAAESGPWRNFYLTGAEELRNGIDRELFKNSSSTSSEDLVINLSLETFYDYMAVRLDRSKSKGKKYTFNLIFPDVDERISLYLVNDVLHNRPGVLADNADATITMNRTTFNDIITKKSTGMRKLLAGEVKIEGSKGDYSDFQSMVESPFNPLFNIIEP